VSVDGVMQSCSMFSPVVSDGGRSIETSCISYCLCGLCRVFLWDGLDGWYPKWELLIFMSFCDRLVRSCSGVCVCVCVRALGVCVCKGVSCTVVLSDNCRNNKPLLQQYIIST
jgi:hypothetical protein